MGDREWDSCSMFSYTLKLKVESIEWPMVGIHCGLPLRSRDGLQRADSIEARPVWCGLAVGTEAGWMVDCVLLLSKDNPPFKTTQFPACDNTLPLHKIFIFHRDNHKHPSSMTFFEAREADIIPILKGNKQKFPVFPITPFLHSLQQMIIFVGLNFLFNKIWPKITTYLMFLPRFRISGCVPCMGLCVC